MRLQNAFSALSPTGLDSQILTVLARGTQPLTIREIHGLLPDEGSVPGLRLAIARLVESGVVQAFTIGRSSGYRLNEEHLLAEPIAMIARAKSRLLERIADHVATWPVPPLVLTLFGSAARDEMRLDSDLDLLIVAPDEAPDLEDHVGDLAQRVTAWTGNDTRPLVFAESEVAPSPIFDSILRDGVHVFGDPAWLTRTLRRRKLAS